MDETSGGLTVYFEDPFWVGVFERISDGKLSVCKVTFGAEPKDAEVWAFILDHYSELRFSPAVEAEGSQTADHPKRRQRNAAAALRRRDKVAAGAAAAAGGAENGTQAAPPGPAGRGKAAPVRLKAAKAKREAQGPLKARFPRTSNREAAPAVRA